MEMGLAAFRLFYSHNGPATATWDRWRSQGPASNLQSPVTSTTNHTTQPSPLNDVPSASNNFSSLENDPLTLSQSELYFSDQNYSDVVPMIVHVAAFLQASYAQPANYANTDNLSVIAPLDYNPPLNYWALLVILLILAGVIGNALVCIAIITDKRLQQPTNYFLVSLAVADLLVSIAVMPLGIWAEFYGFWPFEFYTCLTYTFMDIFCCTASIMHMCLISIDRYYGIKKPLQRTNTKNVRMLKIGSIWAVSLLISCPLIPWSMVNPHYILPEDDLCVISNAYLMIYGSIVAFFIPQITMCVMMFLTVRLLKAQAVWSEGKRAATRRPPQNVRFRSNSNSTPPVSFLSKTNVTNGSSHLLTRIREDSSSETPDDQLLSNSSEASRKVTPVFGKVSQVINRLHKRRRKNYGRSADSEKKATKVLTMVFILFSICWMPFFIFNLIHGVCLTLNKTDCVADVFFHISLWLGWASSIVNPMIYTVINPNFRQAFLFLLTGGRLGQRCRGHMRSTVQTCRERSSNASSTAAAAPRVLKTKSCSPTQEMTWSPTFLSALELNNETPV